MPSGISGPHPLHARRPGHARLAFPERGGALEAGRHARSRAPGNGCHREAAGTTVPQRELSSGRGGGSHQRGSAGKNEPCVVCIDGRSRVRAADRLRQPGKPSFGPRRRAKTGNGGASRTWRRPWKAGAANDHRSDHARTGRRSAGTVVRASRHDRSGAPGSRRPSQHGQTCAGCAAASVHAGAFSFDRSDLQRDPRHPGRASVRQRCVEAGRAFRRGFARPQHARCPGGN